MFDFEQAINEWRSKMRAAGIKNCAVLDELESHLREDAERLNRAGVNAEQAFATAVQNVGRSDLLKVEFAKIGGGKGRRPGKLFGIALCVLAVGIATIAAPSLCTIPEMTIVQRLLGFGAIGVVLFAIASWRFSYKFLPVIRNSRLRLATSIACGLAGALWLYAFGGLLVLVIVPHVLNNARVAPTDNFFPGFTIAISFLWAIAFAAILGAVAYGLEEAGRHRLGKDAYV